MAGYPSSFYHVWQDILLKLSAKSIFRKFVHWTLGVYYYLKLLFVGLLDFCFYFSFPKTYIFNMLNFPAIVFQLLPLLESSFVENTRALSTSPLYTLTADLLNFLYKHNSRQESSTRDSTEESSVLVKVAQEFWTSLSTIIQDHIANSEQNNSQTLARYFNLFD